MPPLRVVVAPPAAPPCSCAALAKPVSLRKAVSESSSRMFAGLKSRCVTERPCR